MNTSIDKSIYGQIKTKGEQLAELVSMAEYIQNNNDKNAAEAYRRGLVDAWEAAKKLYLNDACKDMFGEYFYTFIKNHTAQEAIDKIKAYEDANSIKVGDEVIWSDGSAIIVTMTFVAGGSEWCDGVNQNGRVYHVLLENVRKTGKHYDIQSILEAMRK